MSGGGDADHEVVRFLAEHAQLFEPLAVGAGGDAQLDAGEQAAAADLFDVGVLDPLQLG